MSDHTDPPALDAPHVDVLADIEQRLKSLEARPSHIDALEAIGQRLQLLDARIASAATSADRMRSVLRRLFPQEMA